jgi:hypothetical protein
MLLSAAWSSYPLKNVMSTTHAAGAILIALAAAHHYRSDPGAAVRQVGYALGLNVTLHVVASALLPAYAVDPSGRWTGLAGNANSLGALGAFALWANFAALRAARGGRRALHLGLGAFAVLALVGSESRSSAASSRSLEPCFSGASSGSARSVLASSSRSSSSARWLLRSSSSSRGPAGRT